MKQLLKSHFCQILLPIMLFCLIQGIGATPVYINNFSSFPAYPYNTASYMQSGRYVGCGPTTGAMMMAYYHHVEGMSNSNGLLTNPVTGVNEGLNTAWKLHESQYMDTGANGFGSVYNIEPGMENYAQSRGYEIKVTIHASPTYDPNDSASDWLNAYGPYGESWLNDGDFWTNSGGWNIDPNKFCDFVAAKLSAGIAIFLTIDTDENRSGDHWVALVGYDRATLRYAFYDTYSTTVKWADIYYCDPPGATKDNSISFLRSVEYIGPIQQNLEPPRNLVALNGYHGAVPLAWNTPSSTASRSIPSIPKFTEVHGEQFDYLEIIDAISRQNFDNILQEKSVSEAAQKPSKPIIMAPAGFLGYNVYRSTSSGGSYTKIASKISRQYYYDDSSVNGRRYYYRIKAVYTEGESDPSNTANALPLKDGYVVEAGWVNSSPSIDGVIKSLEWQNASQVEITYPGHTGTVTLYAMNDNNYLYLAVDDGRDNSHENLDQFALFFDENNDQSWPALAPSKEGVIWIAWDQSGSESFSLHGGRYGYWPDHIGLESNVTTPGVKHGMSLASGNVQYEGAYDLENSPLNVAPGNKFGFLVFTYDYDPAYFNAFWPQEAERLKAITPNIGGWGTAPFSFGTMILATRPVTEPDISVTPTTGNFGSVVLNNSVDKTFQLKNVGSSTLNISAVQLTGDTAPFSIISGGGASTIAAGGIRNLVIRFRPTAAGLFQAEVRISSNDPDENPFQIQLSGQGVVGPELSVVPTLLNFGISLNSLTLTVQNTGGGTLNWTITENPDKPWITQVSPTSGSNNGSVTVTVDRDQLAGSNDTGILQVTSNGGNQDVTVTIAKTVVSLPDHWEYAANTGNSASIVLPTIATPNIDGVPLEIGDYIGLFTPAGLCCGWKQWTGSNIALTAWGDDDQTPEMDGFGSNEPIHYRVFRLSESKEWTTVTVEYSQGTGIYTSNGFMVLQRFDVTSQRCLVLEFAEGWNMFSLNVIPEDPDIAVCMTPVTTQLMMVKDGAGNTFIPAYGINDIGSIQLENGYQAYFTQPQPLEICGQPIEPTTPINLPAGWSMISYLPNHPINVTTALSSISTELVIAKNNEGKTYIPLYSINDIGEMLPGQGYQIYLNTAQTLIFPNSGLPKPKLTQVTKPAHFQFSAETGENATVVVSADIAPCFSDGVPLAVGDEIGVYTSDGHCCGAVVWEGKNSAISVWGDNGQTPEIDGFIPKAPLRFRIWRQSDNTEYPATSEYQTEHPEFYQPNGFSVLTSLIADLKQNITALEAKTPPSDFGLFQNFPNPFNPETQIRYDIPNQTHVKLIIYDVKGRDIRTLFQGEQGAGHYHLTWDGRDKMGNVMPNGIYFYQLITASQTFTRKMILVK